MKRLFNPPCWLLCTVALCSDMLLYHLCNCDLFDHRHAGHGGVLLLPCSLIAMCARYHEDELAAGAVQINTNIKHKFADSVPVQIKFELGG